MAVEEVFGGEVIWQSEVDPAASKVLAYRFPCAPNLGDITQIDWKTVETPDVLCGGFPCQDVSAAGKRSGIKDGTRSGLWAYFANAIDQLRPPFVVIENVRGLLSATAHRTEENEDHLEFVASVVGDGSDRPVLRAAGAVLGDLADLGYDAQWTTISASSVGAPHRRERVFIVATDTSGVQPERWGRPGNLACTSGSGEGTRQERQRYGNASDDSRAVDEPGVALLPTPNASDGTGGGQHPDKREGHQRQLIDSVLGLPLLQTPQARDGKGLPGQGFNEGNLLSQVIDVTPSEDGGWCEQCWIEDGVTNCLADEYGYPVTQWGKYAPAIARWEQIAGPAPAPTEPNKNGNPRLSALFSEWMMGWPAGWVTDPDIGISRNEQLKIIGNGVCPQQATAALQFLLSVAVAA